MWRFGAKRVTSKYKKLFSMFEILIKVLCFLFKKPFLKKLRWEYARALLRERNVEHRRRALGLLFRQYKALRSSRRLKRAGNVR